MPANYGNFATFMPAEGSYGRPGQFDSAMKSQALQKSAFMSDMDKFYAGLKESSRQFDEGLAFKEKELGVTKGLGEAELSLTRELGFEKLEREDKALELRNLERHSREILGKEGIKAQLALGELRAKTALEVHKTPSGSDWIDTIFSGADFAYDIWNDARSEDII